jgi:hypothetical protein
MGWFSRQKERSKNKGERFARRISDNGTKQVVTKQVFIGQSTGLISAMTDLGYELKGQSQGVDKTMVVLSFSKHVDVAPRS